MRNLTSMLIISVLFISCASAPKPEDCARFKVGRFQIRSEFADGAITNISRNAFTQTETDVRTGIVIREKIRWISDCEYELTFTSSKGDNADTMVEFLKANTLTTKIISTAPNYYIFQSSVEGGRILTDTMVMVE